MTTNSNPLSPQERAAALRAAHGDRHRPAGPVPMGIRYLTRPTPAPAPAKPRPAWANLLSVAHLVNDDEPAERRPARPASPAVPRARAATPARRPAPVAAAEPVAPPVPAAPRVVRSYDAFGCETCGSRYRFDAADHGCGRLTPVTVTITTRPALAPAADVRVLGSYDALHCETCGVRYGEPVDGHGCGPLTPVVVTIARRGGDPDA
jgi:hypothetical protein